MINTNQYSMIIQPTQCDRIRASAIKYPKGAYIIADNLEGGYLGVFQSESPILMQRLFDAKMKKFPLCVEITVSGLWNHGADITENEYLCIHKINAIPEYDFLVPAMIEQVFEFARFYGYNKLVMPQNVYTQWDDKIPDIMGRFIANRGKAAYIAEV